MAKVQDLKKGLGVLKKKPILAEEKTERIIKKVHVESQPKMEVERKPKKEAKKRGRKKINIEKTVRYTIDIPETTYKAIRHKVVDDGGTMKALIMKAIKKELGLD